MSMIPELLSRANPDNVSPGLKRVFFDTPTSAGTEPLVVKSPLTGGLVREDNFIIPSEHEVLRACLRTKTVCCEVNPECISYNGSFRLLSRFKGFSGVYIFRSEDEKYMYIGQTNSLVTRLRTHNAYSGGVLQKIRDRENTQVLGTTYLFEDPFERFYWEQKWIAEYDPKYSRK